MAVNHVIINGETVVDLRNDTVSADKLLKGATAHDKTGAAITGTLSFATVYTGSGAPIAGMGSDGDIYLDLGGSSVQGRFRYKLFAQRRHLHRCTAIRRHGCSHRELYVHYAACAHIKRDNQCRCNGQYEKHTNTLAYTRPQLKRPACKVC